MMDVQATHAPRARGIAGLAIIAIVMVSVLISLGVWQLHRKDEKHALIAALTERLAAAPIVLPTKQQWNNFTPARDEFTRVTFEASFLPVPEASVYSSGSALRTDISGLGTFVFAPARLSSGDIVVVNRGFVPDGAPVKTELFREPIKLTGYIRFPETAGVFTPHEDALKRLWFLRDHLAMARAGGWGNVAPFYIDLEGPTPAPGLPKPGPLQVHLKDDHLQYAITWFGLALAVATSFGFWIFGQRRR
jgi:surfeit locus 1 family protein